MPTDVVLVRHAASVPPSADGPDEFTRPFTDDWESHYARSWADPGFGRPAGESLDQLTARAGRAIRDPAREHQGGVVLVASHGTFIARALCGFGRPVGWDFWQRMPMPAVYRLRFSGPAAGTVTLGVGQE